MEAITQPLNRAKKRHIKKEVSRLFTGEKLSYLSRKHAVDRYTKKLSGKFVLLTILEVMLSGSHLSLSNLAKQYNHIPFQDKVLKMKKADTVDRTSFSRRLNTIEVEYAREIFKHVRGVYGGDFVETSVRRGSQKKRSTSETSTKTKVWGDSYGQHLRIYDTTAVTELTSRLKEIGFKTPQAKKNK